MRREKKPTLRQRIASALENQLTALKNKHFHRALPMLELLRLLANHLAIAL